MKTVARTRRLEVLHVDQKYNQRRVNYENSLVNISKFTWRLLANTTSIHGLLYIFGKRNVKPKERLMWLIVFLLCISLFLWQCVYGLKAYYQFELKVKTTTRYLDFGENQNRFLPTVVFCREHSYRNVIIGSSKVKQFVLALLSTTTLKETLALQNKFQKITQSIESKDEIDYIHQVIDFLAFDPTEWQIKLTDSVKKCWIANKEVSCSTYFHTLTLPDSRQMFIFNDLALAAYEASFIKKGGKLLNTYLNGKKLNYSLEKVKGFGSSFGGSKFLLNTNQPDTYDLTSPWNGAGYRIKIINPQDINILSMNDVTTLLSPGYSYNIAVTQVTTMRNTKHIDKCNDDVYVMLLSQSAFEDEAYFPADCYNRCLYTLCWNLCNCYPQMVNENDVDDFAKLLGLELSEDVQSCSTSFDRIQCALSMVRKLQTERLNEMCPSCKVQCFEENYQLQITAVKFPQTKTSENRLFLSEVYADEETRTTYNQSYVNNNFLLVNIYYPNTNDYVYVEENQDTTIQDLFVNYIGNAMGLFLGMSFLSPFEIVWQMATIIHYRLGQIYFQKYYSSKTKLVSFHSERQAGFLLSRKEKIYQNSKQFIVKLLDILKK